MNRPDLLQRACGPPRARRAVNRPRCACLVARVWAGLGGLAAGWLAWALLLPAPAALAWSSGPNIPNDPSQFQVTTSGTLGNGNLGSQDTAFYVQYQAKSGNSAVVYWGPATIGLSLDDTYYASNEYLGYYAPWSNLSAGHAEWIGSTYITTWGGSSWGSTWLQTRFVLDAYRNDTGATVPLVVSGTPGISGSAGVLLPMSSGTPYKVVMRFYILDGSWQYPYPYFNALSTPTPAPGDQAMGYQFSHSFFYDRAPTGLSLSSQTVNENVPLSTFVGTFSVSDQDSGSTSVQLTPGYGDNASFGVVGSSLFTATSLDYETKNQYALQATVTDSAGGTYTQNFNILVNNLNEQPYVKRTLGSVTYLEDFGSASIALGSYFGDPDGDGTLSYRASVSPSGKLNASISGSTLNLTSVQDANGTATVTVTAYDNGTPPPGGPSLSTSSPLTVNITPVNDPPTVTTTIPDQSKLEDFASFTLNLDNYYGDVDSSPLAYTVQVKDSSGSAASDLASASISGSTLTITSARDKNGTVKLFTTASDGQYTASAPAFNLVITPVNDSPTFTKGADVTVLEDSGPQMVSSWATGVTNGGWIDESAQVLTFVVSNNNTTLFKTQPAISSQGALTFEPAANQWGSATVSVYLQDNGGTANGGNNVSATRTFTINVTQVNDPPTLATINDVSTTGRPDPATGQSSTLDLALSGITPGPSDPPQNLQVSAQVLSSSVAGLVTATPVYTPNLSTGKVTLAFGNYLSGTARVQVTVTDDGGTANGGQNTFSRQFYLTVHAVDHPPVFNTAFNTNLVVLEDSGSNQISLNGIFADYDLDNWLLPSLSVGTPSLAVASVTLNTPNHDASGNIQASLTVTPLTNAWTRAASLTNSPVVLTFWVAAGNDYITNNLSLTIQEVNDPPTLDPISTQAIDEDSGTHVLNLTGITPGPNESTIDSVAAAGFTFATDQPSLLDVSAMRITNFSLAAGTAQFVYAPKPLRSGHGTITIGLSDNRGGTNSQSFNVAVSQVNHPPSVSSPLPEPFFSSFDTNIAKPILHYLEDQVPVTLSLSNLFTDVDGDLVVKSLYGNTNAALVQAVPAGSQGDSLTLTLTPDAYGAAEITIRGHDAYLETYFNFIVQVDPVNDPPVFDVIPDQRVMEDSGAHTVMITGLAPGPANETSQMVTNLTFQVLTQSDTNLIATSSISYTNGQAVAWLTYTTGPDANGEAVVQVTAFDNGGTNNGGVNLSSRSFKITVNPADDAPILQAPFGSITFDEDQFFNQNYRTNLNLAASYFDLNHPGQPVSLVLVTIDDPVNVLNDEVFNKIKIDENNRQTLVLTFQPDGNGTATVSYRGISEGLLSSAVDTVTVIVRPVNDPPTLNVIPNQVVVEDSGPYTITLAGLSPGPTNEMSQTITNLQAQVLSQTSTGLVQNLTVTYQPGQNTATLSYALGPDQNGTAHIRVTAQDDGGTDRGGIDTTTQDFTITVTPADDPPRATQLTREMVFLEDQFASTTNTTILDLSGFYIDPDNADIQLVLGAIEDPSDILANEEGVTAVSPAANHQLVVQFRPDAYGTARLTIGARAGALASPDIVTLNLTVLPVNDPPTLDPIPAQSVLQGSGTNSFGFANISVGPGEQDDQHILSVTATLVSQTPPDLLDTNLVVTYSTNDTAGTLAYVVTPNRVGLATIRVTVQDDGGTANGGVDTFSRDVVVTVGPRDAQPVLANPIGTVTYGEAEVSGASTNRVVDLRGVYTTANGAGISFVIERINDPGNVLLDDQVLFDPVEPEFLTLAFNPNNNGTATIRYRAFANRRLAPDADTLTIRVLPSDTAPTIDPIFRQTVQQDSGPHTISLTGISPGLLESDEQTVQVTAQVLSQAPTNLLSSLTVNHDGTNSTGTLVYSLTPGVTGKASVRVIVTDTGTNSTFRDFRIVVLDSDDPPFLANNPPTLTVFEDQFAATGNETIVDLTGVFDDAENDAVSLQVRGVSDPANVLVEEQGRVRVNPANQLQLILRFQPDQFGSAQVFVGAQANGRASTNAATLNVNVLPVNDPPTLDPIPPVEVLENSGPQSVSLSGLGVGPANETNQVILSVSAVVTNQAPADLITGQPAVTWSTNSAQATLTYTPTAHRSGTAVIRVIVQDSGGTANGGQDTFTRDLIVTVAEVDVPPVLVAGHETLALEYTDAQLAAVSNIVVVDLSSAFLDPDGDSVQVVAGAISDPDDILQDETPGAIGPDPGQSTSLQLLFQDGALGTARFAVQGLAKGRLSTNGMQVSVTVTPDKGAPSIARVGDVEAFENSGQKQVGFSGVKAGSPASGAANIVSLTASVVSSDPPGLLGQVAVNYRTNDSGGSVQFAPVPNLRGTAVIRLTVTDDGTVSATRTNQFNRDFNVTVVEKDDPPRLTGSFADQQFLEDAFAGSGRQTVLDLSGVFTDVHSNRIVLLLRGVSDPSDMLEDETGSVFVDPFQSERLHLKFRPDAFGEATINLQASAKGLTSSDLLSFKVRVLPVNDPPTLDLVPQILVTQALGQVSVPLTGITPGPANESTQLVQTATVSVDFENTTGLIQTPQVLYQPGATNATLQFSINTNMVLGLARLKLAFQDNGGLSNGGQDTLTTLVPVTVRIQRLPPQLAHPIGAIGLLEDSLPNGRTSVDLSASFSDPSQRPIQLVLGAIWDPQDVLDNENGNVVLDSANPMRLNLAVKTNAFGVATVAYRANAGGQLSDAVDTLTITVTNVNDAPTLNPVPTQTVAQGSGPQTVPLGGIGVGPLESTVQAILSVQAVVVSQTPSDLLAGLPAVAYSGSGPTATLSASLNPARSGQARLRVVVQDNGGTANGGQDTISREFDVVVTPVDHPPVIASPVPAAAQPQTYLEDQFTGSGNSTTLDLSGLFTDPDGDPVTYSVGPITDPDDALDNESGQIRFDVANPARLQLVFKPNGYGVAHIALFGTARGLASPNYDLQITVTGVNDPPTLNPIPDQTVVENSGAQSVSLSGISVGAGERGRQQFLTNRVEVVSQTPSDLLAGDPVFAAGATSSSGRVLYTLRNGRNGSARLRVTLQDNGGTNNGGIDSVSREFLVTVTPAPPVDHPPVLVSSFGQTNFLRSDILNLTNLEARINLHGVFQDPDGDALSLFLTRIVDTNNILNNEMARGVRFADDDPQVLVVTFFTNVIGSAFISYVGVANGQLSTQADTLTIVVADQVGRAGQTVAPVAQVEPVDQGVVLLGLPAAGDTLTAAWQGRLGLPEGCQLRWEVADNDLGLSSREIPAPAISQLVLPTELTGRFVRAVVGPPAGTILPGNPPTTDAAVGVIPSAFELVGGVPLSLESWRSLRLAGLAQAAAADDADPDADGLSNLAEYALGLDPLAPDTDRPRAALVERASGGSALAIDYVLRKPLAGVEAYLETSTDLVHWSRADSAAEVLSETAGTTSFRAHLPAALPFQFIRLRLVPRL